MCSAVCFVNMETSVEQSEDNVSPGSEIKKRELMYRLIISQLSKDGHDASASNLTSTVQPDLTCSPSNRLLKLINQGLKYEEELQKKEQKYFSDHYNVHETGLDLEYEPDVQPKAPEPGVYVTTYVACHKGPCRACVFNNNGQLIATGSVDASIKILDVDRMVAKANDERNPTQQKEAAYEAHPVIRALYDHLDEVTSLAFHPREQVLISGSRDTTVKLFDFSKSSVKKAHKVLEDAEPVTCISLHPAGDYLLVGTTHPVLRLYDLNTAQCFVTNFASHQHTSEVTCVRYSKTGKLFVTGSKDGSIKVWDGVSNRCVNTFPKSHDGVEVCSVELSKNEKYILSSGKDSLVKLWELRASRCLIAYTGAGTTGKQEHQSQAVFNHTEDYVMFPDQATTSLCSWNSRNASRKLLLSLCHNGPVRMIAHSPVTASFISCSDDHRARFWQSRK